MPPVAQVIEPQQPESGVRAMFSLPLEIGASVTANDVTFSPGLRPELIFARKTSQPRWGVGPWAEVTSIDHHTVVGGGATFVVYSHSELGASISAGVDEVWTGSGVHTQPVFSVFGGARYVQPTGTPLDGPFGVRLDVRPGTDGLPTSVTLSATLDTAMACYGMYIIGALLSIRPH
ncbi:MAG TPA: hypothetical protein VGM88_05625 [Kofleriaceae bacterium]